MVSPRNPARHLGRCPSSQSSWVDLPPELLERIITILSPRDRVAICLDCTSWLKSVLESFPSTDLPFEVPRLLIRRPAPHGDLTFFSLHHHKILHFSLPARLKGGRCCGQAAGWIAMALDDQHAVVLYNPASGRILALPPPLVFPVSKVVLSAPPITPGWAAALLSRIGTIVLHQPAVSDTWRTIAVHEGTEHNGFRDMVFCLECLYALGHDGAILSFRADRAHGVVSHLRDGMRLTTGDSLMYLVESDGKVLLVQIHKHYSAQGKVQVQILVLAGLRKWITVEKMAGKALFVGLVVSVVVPVALYAAAGLRESYLYCVRRVLEMRAPQPICEYSLLDHEVTGVSITGGHSADVEPVWITPFV